MKKVFVIAAAALLALASCTKVESTYTPDEAINFQAAVQLAQTKAEINGETTKADTLGYPYDNFGVYAWEDGTAAYIVNEKVTKTADVWSTAKTYYWPKSGTMDFIGYYPQAAAPWVSVSTDALKCESYSISAAENDDLLYSNKAVERTVKNSANGVPMIFHHALAQVGVVVKAGYLSAGSGEDKTTWEIKIKSLYFKDMYKAGGVELSLASDEQNWTLPEDAIWTVSGSTSNISVISSDKTLTTSSDTVLLKKTVMPQNLVVSDASKVMHVDYSIKTTTAQNEVTTQNLSADIKLFGSWTDASDKDAFSNVVDKWQMNKWIFYTLVINPLATTPEEAVITFDPSLIDWQYVDGGTYTL